MSHSLWPHGLQHARLHTVLHYFPEFTQTYVHWVTDTIQPYRGFSVTLCSSRPQSFLALQSFFNESTFHVRWTKYWSFDFSINPSNEYSRSILKDSMVWSLCSPRDSQEFSPAPQFESIDSLMVSLIYGPTITSVHDYWKNYSFDYMDLCQQSNVPAF